MSKRSRKRQKRKQIAAINSYRSDVDKPEDVELERLHAWLENNDLGKKHKWHKQPKEKIDIPVTMDLGEAFKGRLQ